MKTQVIALVTFKSRRTSTFFNVLCHYFKYWAKSDLKNAHVYATENSSS